MTKTQTTNFRLNKPDFRTGPWSSDINENFDSLDTILFNALQAGNVTPWANDELVTAGEIKYDTVTDAFWLNRVTHTTPVTGTFDDERVAQPTYWTPIQFGFVPRGQWTHDTHYAYYDLAYDNSQGLSGFCIEPHTTGSAGSMRDEIDKWAIIIDSQTSGSTPATNVSYDDTATALGVTNAQTAIVAVNTRVDNAAVVVADIQTDVTALQGSVTTNTDDITALSTSDAAKAPKSPAYLVQTADAGLDAERVVTDTTTIDANWATAGQVSFDVNADSIGVTHLDPAAYANATEANAGVEDTKIMTAAKVKSAITAQAPVLGTAASKNVGTAAGNVVQLDPVTAKLPAVDASNLTNLPLVSPGNQAVGSYTLAQKQGPVVQGNSYAGSGLQGAIGTASSPSDWSNVGSALPGTWMLMSLGNNASVQWVGLYRRTA